MLFLIAADGVRLCLNPLFFINQAAAHVRNESSWILKITSGPADGHPLLKGSQRN